MRVAVVGAGGVGGYFGGRLAQAGIETLFVARGATAAALRERGLRVESIKGDFALPVTVVENPTTAGTVDAILFAVKAWQIEDAARGVLPMIGPDTMLVPLENGMEAPDDLARVAGRDHVLGGLCGLVSYVIEPGHIRHVGVPDPILAFGELDNRRSARAEALLAAMRTAGIAADIPPDILRSMWTKFLFITPMSGIGAVTRVPIGVWRAMPETRAMAVAGAHELMAVAAARGVTLAPDAVELTLQRFDGLPPESTSSLQRDVMEGKPSELDAQLGAAVRMGEAAGVPTPVHRFLYHALLPQERRAREEAA